MSNSDNALFELRDLYAQRGIDGLYSHIHKIVTLVVSSCNYPSSYSPTGRWDEDAYYMLTNDFILRILERNGYLTHLLRTARDYRGLIYTLETVFRHFLIDQKKRTVEDNLYRRIVKLLAEDPAFERLGATPRDNRELWTLAGADLPRYTINDDELMTACQNIDRIQVKEYKPESKKLPHLLRTPQLKDLMTQILTCAGAVLTVPQILEVIRAKLGIESSATVSLDQPVPGNEDLLWSDVIGSDISVERLAELNLVSDQVFERLTERERAVLVGRVEGYSMDEIADKLGCSKGTVHNAWMSTVEKVRQSGLTNADDGLKVLNRIMDLSGES